MWYLPKHCGKLLAKREDKMKKPLYFIVALVLGGCATQAKTFDIFGNEAFHIACNGTASQICYAQAKKACPNGYYLVDEDIGVISKSITVRCK